MYCVVGWLCYDSTWLMTWYEILGICNLLWLPCMDPYRLWVSAHKSLAVLESIPNESWETAVSSMHIKTNDGGWDVQLDISGNWRQHKRSDARLFICVLLMHNYRSACLNSSSIVTAALACLISHTYPMFPLPRWSSPLNSRFRFLRDDISRNDTGGCSEMLSSTNEQNNWLQILGYRRIIHNWWMLKCGTCSSCVKIRKGPGESETTTKHSGVHP